MRKHFLIKPKIQLRHLGLTLGALTVAILIGYIFVESLLSSSVLSTTLTPGQWIDLRNDLRLGFLILFVVVLCALGIEHFLFFHSIVGPLYSIENALKRMLNGEYNDPVKIRESDELKDLVGTFEELRKKMKAQAEKKPS
jgi:signal transduction histidine kinase